MMPLWGKHSSSRQQCTSHSEQAILRQNRLSQLFYTNSLYTRKECPEPSGSFFYMHHHHQITCLPACDSKPQGLRLISVAVPHSIISLELEPDDPPKIKFANIYKFFTRVAVHSKHCERLHHKANYFRGSFRESQFDEAQREALAISSHITNTSARSDKTAPTTTTEVSTVRLPTSTIQQMGTSC